MKTEIAKRIITIFALLLFSVSFVYAENYEDYKEPITLWTEINGVSNYPNFGMGLFPVSTRFQFYRSDINLFKEAKFRSKIYFYMEYGFSSVYDSGREWDTGRPYWDVKGYENDQIWGQNGYDKFNVGSAFRQYGAFELWFGQPFIENPIEGSEQAHLFEFRFGLNARYSVTTESLDLGAGGTPTFVDLDGNPRGMFAHANEDNPIIAYPWLNGDRKNLSNYLVATLYFYPYREVREGVQDGVYGSFTFEYGPKWLLNNISPKGYVSADFCRINAYLEEKLVLLDERQSNNWNWFAIYFGHSNTFNHVWGDVVPEHKVPGFYLSSQVSDRFWLHFMGPNFISYDCKSYLELSVNNDLYFGNVVNTTQRFEGFAHNGSLGITMHLRLFGFIRFEYNCSYTFANGLNSSYPSWWQRATLNFYVSV